MKYYEVNFTINPCSQDARDILAAMAGDTGFETFEETDEGLKGYVQQSLFDQASLDQTITFFPIAGTHIIYKVEEAEDKDWNEQWEQEGFEPIEVRCKKDDERGAKEISLVIHDGRHLPNFQPSTLNPPLLIEIDAHLAFGTGTHETTRMICAALLDESLQGKKVLDAGCGTGILGIATLKLGAESVTSYDIDEWSADNTRHNAVINQVDNSMTILCGDASLLDSVQERFDYVLANINRNILLQDMERFRKVMAKGATLIISGFYTEDIPLLEAKGKEFGLTLCNHWEDNCWACILMREH